MKKLILMLVRHCWEAALTLVCNLFGVDAMWNFYHAGGRLMDWLEK